MLHAIAGKQSTKQRNYWKELMQLTDLIPLNSAFQEDPVGK